MSYQISSEFPQNKQLRIRSFSQLFDNMRECYKLFWFNEFVNQVLQGKDKMIYDKLFNDMIAEAWYMVFEHKLNLSPADGLELLIKYINNKIDANLKSGEKKDNIISYLKKTGKIIEFQKNQYISARRIMKLLSNSDALKQYCDIVYDNTQNIPFFTVKSIQEKGFGTEAEELGFEGLFYESLMKYDERFSYSFIGDSLVFSKRWKKFRLIDVLTKYVKKINYIGVYNLIADLVLISA